MDLAPLGHGDRVDQREATDNYLLGVIKIEFGLGEAMSNIEPSALVAHTVGKLEFPEQKFKTISDKARLLAQLAGGGCKKILTFGATSLGYFPFLGTLGVAILADDPGIAFIVDGNDAHGSVLVFDYAVDAVAAGSIGDAILADADPRILVDFPGVMR